MYLYKIQLWAEYEFMNCTRNVGSQILRRDWQPRSEVKSALYVPFLIGEKLDIYNVV